MLQSILLEFLLKSVSFNKAHLQESCLLMSEINEKTISAEIFCKDVVVWHMWLRALTANRKPGFGLFFRSDVHTIHTKVLVLNINIYLCCFI